jgi:signal transduction histidine kinase
MAQTTTPTYNDRIMSQTYANELRADSGAIIIPFITGTVVFLSLLVLVFYFHDGLTAMWPYLVIAALSFGSGYAGNRLSKGDEPYWGSTLFAVGHVLALALLLYHLWQPGSPLPYLAGILIIITGMTAGPRTSIFIWGLASLLTLVAVGLSGQLTANAFLMLLVPIGVNLMLAIAALLSAIEWQTAVDSVSLLHRRAQQRRDELFAIQEEVTLANKKLQSLNRELDQARQAAENERDLRTRFMNNVSHELRTPLNAIVNFAHIMREGGCGPVTGRQHDYLGRIESSGWHLLGVLNDLLDMAQIQSGEFKLFLEPSNLHAICEEAMTSLRGLILDKEDVELIREYPSEWPTVYIDEMRIKQALINMLGNSAKYTEVGHIALRVRPYPDEVEIIIEDTGVGISPEYHDVIFQEFRQVDEKAARRRVGTGLGLPITRHLIERHQGQITVDSDVGKGTRFIISLPILDNGDLPSAEETAVEPDPNSAGELEANAANGKMETGMGKVANQMSLSVNAL